MECRTPRQEFVMPTSTETIEELASQEYKWGWNVDLEADEAPMGLNEDIIRFISHKKNEPKWLLDWRLKAFEHWKGMEEPHWAKVHHAPIDYQGTKYYSAPKPKKKSMDEVDPEVLAMFDKLGVPVHERAKLAGVEEAPLGSDGQVAVDAVVDSVSVTTTFQKKLADLGIIFCGFSEAV